MGVEKLSIVEWAAQLTEPLISPLGARWLHTLGVVKQAQRISSIFDEEDRAYLIASAYLHDIGYAPSLRKTGFHPLDGAHYLLSFNQQRLASLVAYHSGAQFEAQLRNLAAQLNKIPCEHSPVADALTYCDMTTDASGNESSFEARINNIFQRYNKSDIVSQAIHQAEPSLALMVERTQQRLREYKSVE